MKVFATLLISCAAAAMIFNLGDVVAEISVESMGQPEVKKTVNVPPDATCANYEQICSDEAFWRPLYPSESHCKSHLFWILCTVDGDDGMWSEIVDESMRELEQIEDGEEE